MSEFLWTAFNSGLFILVSVWIVAPIIGLWLLYRLVKAKNR